MKISTKAALVVKSCKTSEQRQVARRYLELAERALAEHFHSGIVCDVESWALEPIRDEQDSIQELYLSL